MRYLYLFLKTTLPYSLGVMFRKIKSKNAPKEALGRTFFACNHASAFMDPLIPASINRPVVHFMTRADIYKGIVKHLFYHSHMIPIYRQHDGDGHNEKNQEVFKIVSSEVAKGKNILVFAEGFTDDIFVRRLKPVKKGIVRMAFFTLEENNWSFPVYIQTLGINYTNPGVFRSEVLMNYGKKICLNDYCEAYQENPQRIVKELSSWVEMEMQNEITHVEKEENLAFHENIMILTRKGMNPFHHDQSIDLEKRFQYSKALANWINDSEPSHLSKLKTAVLPYFSEVEKKGINEEDIFDYSKNGNLNNSKLWAYLILLSPLALLGFFHGWISWLIIKPKVEKAFKRKVFWSSVKMVLSHFISGLYNLLLIIPLYLFVHDSVLIWLIYLVLFAGPTFVIFWNWQNKIKILRRRQRINMVDLKFLAQLRENTLAEVMKSLPNL